MNQVAVKPAHEMVADQKGFFESVGSNMDWAKESQFAIQALQNNKYLYDTAVANPGSLQNAIINVNAVGISLNPALKHAYLVPRSVSGTGMICLDISFMGLLSLGMKSGAIKWGQAKIVYENDVYENAGIDKAPIHKQKTFGDKGKMVGVYCTVKTGDGDYLTEEMDMDAINKVKASSKAANGPWKTWFDEMARKTVVKRGAKYWPDAERVGMAVDVLNQHEGLSDNTVTTPDIATITEDQKAYFDQLIESGNALDMYALSRTLDVNDASSAGAGVWVSLLHSFPKGQKGKYQDLVKSLRASGESQFFDFITDIESNIEDEMYIKESIEGLSSGIIKLIGADLNPEISMKFQQVIK